MKILALVALTAVCFAAPSPLDHPTPINPSVLIESKPLDKIFVISDINEIAKYKRETNKPLYPTALPDVPFHHITKRDHKNGHESNPKKHETQETTPSAVIRSTPKRSRREQRITPEDVHKLNQEENLSMDELQKPQTKRDIPVPLVAKHKHPETTDKERDEEELKEISDVNKDAAKEEPNHQKIQDKEGQMEDLSGANPGHKSPSVHHSTQPNHAHEYQAHLPLVKHSPEIPNVSNDHVPESVTGHPVIRPKPVPVTELFARHHDNQKTTMN